MSLATAVVRRQWTRTSTGSGDMAAVLRYGCTIESDLYPSHIDQDLAMMEHSSKSRAEATWVEFRPDSRRRPSPPGVLPWRCGSRRRLDQRAYHGAGQAGGRSRRTTGCWHDPLRRRYIASWLEGLKKDKNEIFRASSAASATDYILNREAGAGG